MEVTLLNTDFEAVAIIDVYKSIVWTDRFNECGDFEIYIPIQDTLPDYIKKNYYLQSEDSEHLMIIETITIESNDEDGAYYTISGRSLESILSRRIVWDKTVFSMDENGVVPNLQNGIEKLLNDNVINPSIAVRKINNFIFEASDDVDITKLDFEAEYLGEDMYSIISNLCKENEIGFKLTYHERYVKNDVVYNNAFVFKLYAGVNRSYEQSENPYVIFSPNYDNVYDTKYLDSDKNLKNVTLVVGESEYNEDGTEKRREQRVLYIEDVMHSGIDRREIFTDATGLSTDDGYGGTLSADRYEAQLKQKGIDTLMENTSLTAFEGKVDPIQGCTYGEDYFMGDIVQIENEYGQEGTAYISEFVITCDEGGMSAYPTFQTIQRGVYENE